MSGRLPRLSPSPGSPSPSLADTRRRGRARGDLPPDGTTGGDVGVAGAYGGSGSVAISTTITMLTVVETSAAAAATITRTRPASRAGSGGEATPTAIQTG